jgi:hypothetical protein
MSARDQVLLPAIKCQRPSCGGRWWQDAPTPSTRQHWHSFDELKSIFRELAMATDRDTGEYEIPS